MPDRDFSLRKILVATDFSRHATAALSQAANLADRTRAEVTVVHVITNVAGAVEGTSFEVYWQIPPAELKKAERKLRRQVEERLAEAIALYRSPGRQLRTETLVGIPFVEIIRVVQQRSHDLVVVGTRGLSKFKRFLVGSTAERLVRKCPCPVWVVKPGHERPLRSILVPVDFSEVSGRSLQMAAFLANQFNASLTVLHILSSATDVVQIPEDPARLDIRLQRTEVRRVAARHLNDFVGSRVQPGMAVKKMLAVGTAWEKIERVARRLDVDLIVMGSVGRAGIPGLLIGNTAEKVLRHCDRSILTVKPIGFVSPIQPEP